MVLYTIIKFDLMYNTKERLLTQDIKASPDVEWYGFFVEASSHLPEVTYNANNSHMH